MHYFQTTAGSELRVYEYAIISDYQGAHVRDSVVIGDVSGACVLASLPWLTCGGESRLRFYKRW